MKKLLFLLILIPNLVRGKILTVSLDCFNKNDLNTLILAGDALVLMLTGLGKIVYPDLLLTDLFPQHEGKWIHPQK